MKIKDVLEKEYQEARWSETKKEDIKVKKVGEPLGVGCPECKSVHVRPTGKTHDGNRVYQCLQCGNYIASPTSYAKCIIYNIIGSDSFVNDCFICPTAKKEGIDVRKLAKEGKCCPYFRGVIKPHRKELDVSLKK